MPRLEEFTKAVKEIFQECWWSLTAEQVNDYIYGEEAQSVIVNRYNEAVKNYKSGKITKKIFMIGVVSSVANCLCYMYDGNSCKI